MSRRRRTLIQWASGIGVPGAFALAGHGRYPLWVDLLFYVALGTLTARLAGQAVDSIPDRKP